MILLVIFNKNVKINTNNAALVYQTHKKLQYSKRKEDFLNSK
jgi:hypothetical protein